MTSSHLPVFLSLSYRMSVPPQESDLHVWQLGRVCQAVTNTQHIDNSEIREERSNEPKAEMPSLRHCAMISRMKGLPGSLHG